MKVFMTLENPSDQKLLLGLPVEEISQYWDRIFSDRRPMVDRQTVVLVQDALQPYLSPLGPEQAVLDLAAGADAVYYPPGFDMSRVTALDASSVALSLNPSGHKDQADFRAPLNYPDNTFGLVVCAFGVRYTRC
jgi:ubiquinone/menaquinone biosynthesis C-methylase UbiE